MRRFSLVITLLVIATAGSVQVAYSQSKDNGNGNDKNKHVTAAPEIDPASAISALTLLAGGLAVIRGRRREP